MNVKYLIFLLSLYVSVATEAAVYKFLSEKGKVTFLAKGRPALISIKGEGAGVSGLLHEVNGQITGELSFDLVGLKTGIELRDDHLKNKYLEVAKFAEAKLTITSFKLPSNTKDRFRFNGVLTLHGESRPIEGLAEIVEASASQTLKSEFKINLSQFKIEIPSFQGITVAEEVSIKVEVPVFKSE